MSAGHWHLRIDTPLPLLDQTPERLLYLRLRPIIIANMVINDLPLTINDKCFGDNR